MPKRQPSETLALTKLLDTADDEPTLSVAVFRVSNYYSKLTFMVAAFMSLEEAIWYIKNKCEEYETEKYQDSCAASYTVVCLGNVY